MFVPLILLLLSLVDVAAGTQPGLSDFMLLAVPCTIASAYLLYRALTTAPVAEPPWILIDGSNVMHWKDGTPQLATLREVVDHLKAEGFTIGVVLDANAGYKINGRYQHDLAFGRLLNLPESQVMVVAKGTPADPALLASARDLGARIVTNDRFRDWAEKHPEVAKPGHLIRGGYRKGQLWLDLDRQPDS
ncbi:MAG: hypothetical protein ABI832_07655 [bacterium]